MPPGRTTSGSSAASSDSSRAATEESSERSGSCQVYGRRLRRANSTIRRVASEERRADDVDADSLPPLERLAPRREGGEQELGERRVVEEERAKIVAIDRDIPHRLRDDRGQVDSLTGQEVDLAEEAGRSVPDDLVAGAVEDRSLALDDRDERVPQISNPKEHVTDSRRALLTDSRERCDLPLRQDRFGRSRHAESVPRAWSRPTRLGLRA